MKTLAPLFLAAITFGCAHEAIEQPTLPYHAIVPAPSISTDAPIALAQKNYANGLVNEAFAGLQSAYQENQDLKYLEYSATLVDQAIRWMKSTMQEKAAELHDANYVLETFYKDEKVKVNTVQAVSESACLLLPEVPTALIYGYFYQKAKNEKLGLQKIKAEYVYSALRDNQIEKYSKETFIPRMDMTKNAMLKIQPLLSQLISIPSPNYDRLLLLKTKTQKQREIICELRMRYTSDIFIGPRVNLGDKLVFMARCDRPNLAGMWPGSLNTYWIDKLSALFTKDYGEWVAQTDERTRLQFAALARNCKNALGEAGYKDFQTILDLLSNNKKGGNDLWWPKYQNSRFISSTSFEGSGTNTPLRYENLQ
jgi:hypothetical protein